MSTFNKMMQKTAVAAIDIYTEGCMELAKENWCKSQVEMLEHLFEEAKKRREYKCAKCFYIGKPGDAPESASLDCMWQPSEENGWNMPCDGEDNE